VDNPRPEWFPKIRADEGHVGLRFDPDADLFNDLDGNEEKPFICEL